MLFCGLKEKSAGSEVMPEMEMQMTSVVEDPKSTVLVDTSCLLMLCVSVFLFAYYGWYLLILTFCLTSKHVNYKTLNEIYFYGQNFEHMNHKYKVNYH